MTRKENRDTFAGQNGQTGQRRPAGSAVEFPTRADSASKEDTVPWKALSKKGAIEQKFGASQSEEGR